MNELDRVLDVVVIGGGQAGLATGWHLLLPLTEN